MFVARAGLTGRSRRHQQSGVLALLGGQKKKKKDKFRCWVPFMLRPCVAGSVGLVVLLGGAAMCLVGFYAAEFSLQKRYNDTADAFYLEVEETKAMHLSNLKYGGPVMMGVGCFVIIIACVVVCEERDKRIKEMIEEEEKRRKKKGYKPPPKKENIIERIVMRIKQCTEAQLPKDYKFPADHQTDIEKSDSFEEKKDEKPAKFRIPCTGGTDKQSQGEKSYSNIRNALLAIPANIFTVDIEARKTSLLPVTMTPETQPQSTAEQIRKHYNRIQYVPPPRSRSAPCVHDLQKYKEGNMGQIYLPHEQFFHNLRHARHDSDDDDPMLDDDSVFDNQELPSVQVPLPSGSRNLGYSSSSSSCSSCSHQCGEVEGKVPVDHLANATYDTIETLVQMESEVDTVVEKTIPNGTRHKVIVHQASVHSEDTVEPNNELIQIDADVDKRGPKDQGKYADRHDSNVDNHSPKMDSSANASMGAHYSKENIDSDNKQVFNGTKHKDKQKCLENNNDKVQTRQHKYDKDKDNKTIDSTNKGTKDTGNRYNRKDSVDKVSDTFYDDVEPSAASAKLNLAVSHTAGPSLSKYDNVELDVITASGFESQAIGYRHKQIPVDSKYDELTQGIARANARAMDSFKGQRQSPPKVRKSSQSSLRDGDDNMFMSEAKVRELKLSTSKTKQREPPKQQQGKAKSSKVDRYALKSAKGVRTKSAKGDRR